jgi:undecaprenyl-diphosphatase
VCGLGVWLLGRGQWSALDVVLMQRVHGWATPWATTAWTLVTSSGSSLFTLCVVAGVAVALDRQSRRSEAIMLVLAVAGSALVGAALKATIRRPRPDLFLPLVRASGWSFPSGHTLNAIALYGMLAWLAGQARPGWQRVLLTAGAFGWAGLVGFSRIYLGAHYPSDVAASMLIGILWLSVLLRVGQLRPRLVKGGD